MSSSTSIAVSVIVPIYNAADYIEDCCKQLVSQTLKEIEIILVDDGSDDLPENYWDNLLMRYPAVRFIRQDHSGVSIARNRGIAAAHGRYIAFVDVDDQFDRDLLEFEYRIATSTNADVVCLDPVSKEQGKIIHLNNPQKTLECLLDRRIGMSCCNKLFKKELVATGPFPAGTRIHEDLAALYSVFCASSRVVCINANKYHYIHREGSGSRASTFTEKYFDGIQVIDRIVEDISTRWPSLLEAAEARRAMVYLRISKIYWLRHSPSDYRQRIDDMRRELRCVSKELIRKHFSRNDRIRLALYLHCLPLFRLTVKTIDTN